MAHSEETVHINVLPPDKEKIKKLWMTALWMLIITIIEFVIAFTIAHGQLKVWIFIEMTIVKAGFIVVEFMHLRSKSSVLLNHHSTRVHCVDSCRIGL